MHCLSEASSFEAICPFMHSCVVCHIVESFLHCRQYHSNYHVERRHQFGQGYWDVLRAERVQPWIRRAHQEPDSCCRKCEPVNCLLWALFFESSILSLKAKPLHCLVKAALFLVSIIFEFWRQQRWRKLCNVSLTRNITKGSVCLVKREAELAGDVFIQFTHFMQKSNVVVS